MKPQPKPIRLATGTPNINMEIEPIDWSFDPPFLCVFPGHYGDKRGNEDCPFCKALRSIEGLGKNERV